MAYVQLTVPQKFMKPKLSQTTPETARREQAKSLRSTSFLTKVAILLAVICWVLAHSRLLAVTSQNPQQLSTALYEGR